MPEPRDPASATPLRVLISVLFGALFVALAVYLAVFAESADRLATLGVAVVLGGLGVDLMVSAVRGKSSLLSRLGPLP